MEIVMNSINRMTDLFNNPIAALHDCIQTRDVILRDLNPKKPKHDKSHYYKEILLLSKEAKTAMATHLLKRALVISILVMPIYDLYQTFSHASKALAKILPAIIFPILEIPLYLFGFGIEYNGYNLSAVCTHAIKTVLYITMAASSPFIGAIHPKTLLLIHQFLDLADNQITNYEFEKAAQCLIEEAEKILENSKQALEAINAGIQPETMQDKKTEIDESMLKLTKLIDEFNKMHPQIENNPKEVAKAHKIIQSQITSHHNGVIRVWQNAVSNLPLRLKEIEEKRLAELKKPQEINQGEKIPNHPMTIPPTIAGKNIRSFQFWDFYKDLFIKIIDMRM